MRLHTQFTDEPYIHKSADTAWPKWAVVNTTTQTLWFDTEEQARFWLMAVEIKQALRGIATAGEIHGDHWDAPTLCQEARRLLSKLEDDQP